MSAPKKNDPSFTFTPAKGDPRFCVWCGFKEHEHTAVGFKAMTPYERRSMRERHA
jgi:hypothetical protein